jgi:hypothetical protein
VKPLFAIALLLVAAPAQAALDQSQTIYNGGVSARTEYSYSQTFRAGITGTLSEIRVGFFNEISGMGSLRVYAGSSVSGVPVFAAQVNVTSTGVGVLNWNTWAVNCPVVAGSYYTFQFIPLAMPQPFGLAIGVRDPYAFGALRQLGGLDQPITVGGPNAGEVDLVFETHVTP